MTAPFRIGGYYKQRTGGVTKVIRVIADHVTKDFRNFSDGGAVEVLAGGWRRASDGLAFNIYSERLPEFDIIPGECDEHGNPLEDKKEPASQRFAKLDPDIIANDSGLYARLVKLRGGCSCHISPPCFNCSEPLTQDEADALGLLDDDSFSKTPILDKLENERDPQRAPLPYFTERAKFDPFADYAVKSSVILGAGPNEFTGSGPLQRSPDLQDESLSRHQLATVKG